jgi:predicted CXXCH cytochrome family protein
VSSSCSSCHGGAEGFRFYLEFGVGKEVLEQGDGLDCATCHDTFGDSFDVHIVDSVTFPGGAVVSDPGQASNLCITCHRGRESKATIDAYLATPGTKSFRNVHYLPAGGVKLGTLAKVGYEFDTHTYSGEWNDHLGGSKCTSCHDPVASRHSFLVAEAWDDRCSVCHSDEIDLQHIRVTHNQDYDNDGDINETLAEELGTLSERLLDAMHAFSALGGTPLCYDEHAYPYFFRDTDGSGGLCNGGEASGSNRFTGWNPQLIRAAHNYQLSVKEPGAWAHNFDYVAQLLIDSIEHVQGNVTGLIRPLPN